MRRLLWCPIGQLRPCKRCRETLFTDRETMREREVAGWLVDIQSVFALH